MIEVNYTGKEKQFDTIEEAQDFADDLNTGYDIWVNGKIYKSSIKNFKTGEEKVTVYK